MQEGQRERERDVRPVSGRLVVEGEGSGGGEWGRASAGEAPPPSSVRQEALAKVWIRSS